MMRTHQVFRMK